MEGHSFHQIFITILHEYSIRSIINDSFFECALLWNKSLLFFLKFWFLSASFLTVSPSRWLPHFADSLLIPEVKLWHSIEHRILIHKCIRSHVDGLLHSHRICHTKWNNAYYHKQENTDTVERVMVCSTNAAHFAKSFKVPPAPEAKGEEHWAKH